MSTPAEAVIEDGQIVIRVPIENLPDAIEGAWSMGLFETRLQVTDLDELAKSMVYILNGSDESGVSPVHSLFDKAIQDAFEQGDEGIDEHPRQSR